MECGSELPLKTGLWCPDCLDGLKRLCAEHGVESEIERVQ
jgi:hypothetical protein